MATGAQNGVHTNHERMTGLNGGISKSEVESEKDKGKAVAGQMVNGDHAAMMQEAALSKQELGVLQPTQNAHNLYQLPDEIQHITTDILALGLLLTRLAQVTHNDAQQVISLLASKALPESLVNGNLDYRSTPAEDLVPESMEKKRIFLEFLKTQHTKWLKALVITDWSKKSDQVGRLIDIRSYLASQLDMFNVNQQELFNLKRELTWARLPSPDLKTALQILEDGEAPFLPEFGYVEPPPIPPREIVRNIENLNTILSVRLSLEEFDRMPIPFREYKVHSGRATFTIKGEFEVDLTVGDEDFETQFWFIDFRILFTPAPEEVPDYIRGFLEEKANDALKAEGLAGCYKLLHEFVLTLKITEVYQQALALSRGRWIETLKVEKLNRAMSFQYWANRHPTAGPLSWVIVGTKSSDDNHALPEFRSPSSIYLRWFRDNKEVKEFDIPFDLANISVEDLLKVVVARHVEHTLTSVHDKLMSKPRFADKQATLTLKVSKEDPTMTSLTVPLFDDKTITLSVDPMAGYFLLSPQSPLMQDAQRKLNASLNLPDEIPAIIERFRVMFTAQEINHRSRTSGWMLARSPIRNEELKSIIPSSRETYQSIWMQHRRLPEDYYMLLTMSLAGDRWWLLRVTRGNQKNPGHVTLFTPLPLTTGSPSLSDTFLNNLIVFSAGVITRVSDMTSIRSQRARHFSRLMPNSLPHQIRMPSIFVRLSDLLRSRTGYSKPSRPWAKDFVMISFQGAQNPSERRRRAQQNAKLKFVVEARLSVTDISKFSLLKGKVDRDVIYNSKAGQFCLRLCAEVGQPALDLLVPRLRALERLVDFIDAIAHGGKEIVPRSMTLRSINFAYGEAPGDAPILSNAPQQHSQWQASLNLSHDQDITVTLTKGNPHLRILDFLNILANTRFEQLPGYLLRTLPFFKTLDRIEDGWGQIQANLTAQFTIYPKSLESFTIQYLLGSKRTMNLDVRLQSRKGQPMWHVRRLDVDSNPARVSANATSNKTAAQSRLLPPDDDFTKALGPKVWSTSGAGWKGLESGAAADLDSGIENLLTLINQIVHTLVSPVHPNLQAPQTRAANAMARQSSQAGADQTPPSTAPSNRFSQNSASQGRPSQNTITPASSQGSAGIRGGGKGPTSNVVVLD